MNFSTKKILCVDLAKKTFEVKNFPDLVPFLGGVGLGLKVYALYAKDDPIVLSIGPLNGFFPFVSKTSVVLNDNGVIEDFYIGGSLSWRIKFAGIDSIVLAGKSATPVSLDIFNDAVNFHESSSDLSTLGLPGKRSVLERTQTSVILDNFFMPPEAFLFKKLETKNLNSIVITGSNVFNLVNKEKYAQLYGELLLRSSEVRVNAANFPSCSGCPLGCDQSQVGELGGNILTHCLVSCGYADKIYSDTGVAFSCLNVLGYPYTHEDIEKVPTLAKELLDSF